MSVWMLSLLAFMNTVSLIGFFAQQELQVAAKALSVLKIWWVACIYAGSVLAFHYWLAKRCLWIGKGVRNPAGMLMVSKWPGNLFIFVSLGLLFAMSKGFN
jgi:hypothetical protein